MLAKWLAKIRAWLIDLVREAIRIERITEQPQFYRATPKIVSVIPKPASKPLTEPSFEQMQAAAIQSQEKYYAPLEQ